jgi:hypothetical protein
MIKLKDREELALNAFLVCAVAECQDEATDLFTTEVNMIDVCKHHKEYLINQAFIS